MKRQRAAKSDPFRSVKRRFLLTYMITFSLLILGILSAVLIVTYRTTMAEQWDVLDRNTWKQAPWGGAPPTQMEDMQFAREGEKRQPGTPPNMTQVFDVVTDDSGDVLFTHSLFVQDEEEAYLVALEAALADGGERGALGIGETRWLYARKAWDGVSVYSFLDITQQHDMIVQLAFVLALVAAGSLALIFLLSRFFAERAIRPMRETWNRQNQFLLDASHELRTPLTVIAANVDLVLSAPEETVQSQGKWLGYVRDEARRMTGLTNDLLWIARNDIQRERETFGNVDLSAAASNAATGMEVLLFEKGIEFVSEIQPGIHVVGDARLLEQATLILLDNACKYTEQGGRVELVVRAVGREAVIAVSNTGEGIPGEHAARIFDRFYRTDAARSRGAGGHGLGLAIARSIIERHRGRISVRSIPSEKTTFQITMRSVVLED